MTNTIKILFKEKAILFLMLLSLNVLLVLAFRGFFCILCLVLLLIIILQKISSTRGTCKLAGLHSHRLNLHKKKTKV